METHHSFKPASGASEDALARPGADIPYSASISSTEIAHFSGTQTNSMSHAYEVTINGLEKIR
jgi:hypothetical protein